VDLEELKQAVYTADPAAVLVSPRILRRVLQAEFNVPYLLVQVPHERSYFFDRQILFRHVEQDELALEPDRLLPPKVVLLVRPTAEALQAMGHDAALLRYWRLLFHAHVHMAFDERFRQSLFTPADARARIDKIGQTEFEEIRMVLDQEHYLLPPADDLSVYIEFAAVYLELRYFRSNLRSTYFPAIRDFQVIDDLLAQDLNADELFAKTRLPGAPTPVVRTDTSSDESHDYYWKLMRHAERAGREGDTVRAAILRTKAARVAPVSLTGPTRAEALANLETLTLHLQDVLNFSPERLEEWLRVLPALLDRADQGSWPVEAKLLYDLQTVCIEYERKLYALDVVEWGLSAGRRPIKRPLSSLQIVRVVKYLRKAAQRLTMARVSDEDRQRLGKLFQDALNDCAERLRERFRPILHGAFYDVGLTWANPPEKAALEKIIEELLDRIAQYGFFTFADLRDSLSRNQLKLADLADPHSFWQGDPLLRLDRRLATLMEGVYRHGEFYLRWLERFGTLAFGTPAGRFITLNVVLPFGGAFALLFALAIVGDYAVKIQHWFAPTKKVKAEGNGAETAVVEENTDKSSESEEVLGALKQATYLSLPVGLFILALMRFASLREFLQELSVRVYRLLRLVLYEWPTQLWRLPLLRRLFQSWPALFLYWYVLKPLPIGLLAYWAVGNLFGLGTGWSMALFVAAASLVLNSRFGSAIQEAFVELVIVIYGWLRFDLIQGIFRWVNYFFKQIITSMEYILYTVDEWLRFRNNEGRLNMVLRAVLAFVWFPIGYLIRLYFILLLEPTLNPIKLPISSLAFKLMFLMPQYYILMNYHTHLNYLTPHMSYVLAFILTWTVMIPTMWLLPGVWAFFIWELLGNWRLYRANRPVNLQPAVLGRHGETVLQLLRPGFHSGTIPHLFAQLRCAERSAYRTGSWRPARTYRQALQEVARLVQLFIEREFIVLLHDSKSWPNRPVRVSQIVLSCNRIRIELAHAEYPDELLILAFEERSGWLIGSLQQPGWLRHISPGALQVMTTALAGLYKLAGVDFVREQLAALLSPSLPGFDLTDHQLVVWNEQHDSHEIAYDLRHKRDKLKPLHLNGQKIMTLPLLDARHVFFSRIPLTWEQWVDYWQKDQEGKNQSRLVPDSIVMIEPDAKA
jgi:hypothetical protein